MKYVRHLMMILMFSALFLNACGGGGGGGGGSNDPGNPVQNDKTPPAKISITGLTVSANSITFTWNDPSDSDFDHIEATYGETTEIIAAGNETFSISGLTASTVYTIKAVSIDNAVSRFK